MPPCNEVAPVSDICGALSRSLRTLSSGRPVRAGPFPCGLQAARSARGSGSKIESLDSGNIHKPSLLLQGHVHLDPCAPLQIVEHAEQVLRRRIAARVRT